MQETREPAGWDSLIDELLDEELATEEAVELAVEDLEVQVPLAFGEDPPRAEWRFDGTVRVHADGHAGPLYEWVRLWRSRDD